MVRERVFQLRSLKTLTRLEFEALDKKKREIEASEKRRHTMRVYAMTAFFTGQFFLGYHAIYNVGWLGWDLVEPVTYSVGQGSFILGLLIILRNRGANVEYSDLEELYCRKKRANWMKKYNFDLKRHAFLKRSLERIEQKLERAEEQRFK